MYEYVDWSKLLVGLAFSTSILLASCADDSDLHDVPMPSILTLEQLFVDSKSFVGREVVLKGYLGISDDKRYQLSSSLQNEQSTGSQERIVYLEFGPSQPDPDRMANCLAVMTIVIGDISEGATISPTVVTRESDALRHSPSYCYDISAYE